MLSATPSRTAHTQLLNAQVLLADSLKQLLPAHATFGALHQLLPRAPHVLRADGQRDQAVAAAAIAVELVRTRVPPRQRLR